MGLLLEQPQDGSTTSDLDVVTVSPEAKDAFETFAVGTQFQPQHRKLGTPRVEPVRSSLRA